MGDDDVSDALRAALATGDLAAAQAATDAFMERSCAEANARNREISFLQWAQAVNAERAETEHDPLRRVVLERRRQVATLRDAEGVLRSAVDAWPVLRRDAFPPGVDVDRAFAALTAATHCMERAADLMTAALWVTVPPGRKAEKHHEMAEEVMQAAQSEVETRGGWPARDRVRMDRIAREADSESRQARAHHVEGADVDEMIIHELVEGGVDPDQALAATIDDADYDTPEALRKRKRARYKWWQRNGSRLYWRARRARRGKTSDSE